MSKYLTRQHILSVVVALVILIVVFILLSNIKVTNHTPTTTPINQIEDLPSSQIPRDFPKDVPIEDGAVIVSNYNATSPEGQLQATRVFASQRTVTENFNFYKSWLTKNKWQILSEVNDPSQPLTASLVGQNKTGILSISIAKSTTGAVSVVDISFVSARP